MSPCKKKISMVNGIIKYYPKMFRLFRDRYMKNRPGQFEYKSAIDQQLPIGSGKIESAHRSLIQKRLKLPGAWWKKQHADQMIQLRVARANGKWDCYWQQLQRA